MTRRGARRRQKYPYVIGLTGSMAMGKSTAAAMMARLGIPVFDADAAVHDLGRRGGRAVAAVVARFPDAVVNGAIDRAALGRAVFGDPVALRDLERIFHPLVQSARRRWLATQTRHHRPIVVFDIPLLFETEGQAQCNAVWVVSAPAFLQRQRALSRPGMTPEKFAGALARQTPDVEKRHRADLVLPTGLGRRETLRRIAKALKVIRSSCR